MPAYFNIWAWILPKLTAGERGTKRGSPQPEAILKWSHPPIADPRRHVERKAGGVGKGRRSPPAGVHPGCKNKRIARALYEWIGEDKPPCWHPVLEYSGVAQRAGSPVTIRVDTGVVHETDTGNAKADENTWMRLIWTRWARRTGRPISRAGRFIPRASRTWQGSWAGRCIRLVATYAASSASAC